MLKERIKKILILTIISMMMFNFIGTNVVYGLDDEVSAWQGTLQSPSETTSGATTPTEDDPVKSIVSNPTGLDQEMKIAEYINPGSMLADGLVGIFTYFERLKIVIIGGVFQFLGTVVGESAGSTNSGTVTVITPEDILFNKLAITDINFFKLSTFGTASNQQNLSGSDNPIKLLKQNVANWYMTIRTISMIILAAILIYIGIRMVLASNPESKVNYKKMFTNWLVSFAMVFLLHYIIVLVINLNAVLVDMIASVADKALAVDGSWMGKYMTQLVLKSFLPLATISWSAAIVYVCIVALTFIFLIMYIKRMITIAFLILISPIITITYSIDKAGNGKAEAFSSWMKEFMHNVLIQPFHCLIYVAFVAIAMKMLQGTGTLAASILVIITMFFILEAENLIKQIFGISSKSTGSALATAAVLSTAYEKLKPSKTKDAKEQSSNNGQNATTTKNGNKTSMAAEKNMKATETTKNNMDENEKLNRVLSDETGDLAQDYDDTMNYSQDKDAGPSFIGDPEFNKAGDMEFGEGNWELVRDERGYWRHKVKDLDNEQHVNHMNKIYGEGNWEHGIDKDGYYYQKISEKKNNQKSDFEQFKDGAKMVGKVFVSGNKATSGLAGAVIGGSLAGLSGGDLGAIIGSMAVGKKVQNYAEGEAGNAYDKAMMKWKQQVKETNIKNDERTLATAFNNFKNSDKYQQAVENSKSAKTAKAAGKQYGAGELDLGMAFEYLDMDREQIDAIQDEDERKYAQALHEMRNIYANDEKSYREGKDYTDARIITTMADIINGEIQPNDE